MTVTTGIPGTVTLRFTAGGQTRELTVVVGPPAPGTEPPIVSPPIGVVLLAAPSAGRLITSPAAQATFTLQLLSANAPASTPVTVTSSNAGVANVAGSVVIPAGSRGANVTVQTGVQGTATLTFRAGADTRELTIVVGTPPAGTEPPIVASPVGVVMLQQRLFGTVFSAISGQASVDVTLLSSPASSPTAVVVTTTDANVAAVTNAGVVKIGSQVASLQIVTGRQGVATLTLRAGSDVAQVVVVVGTPPASQLPLVTARIVGVEVK